ncbi:MAG TPA: Ig-like domain-containing protein [Vicinamibacterales bacterium]|nr:Ig-like domain-containing protein [Vicinamibacterales bacterium]
MTKRTATTSALAIVLAMLLAACDKVPLIAPSGSAITLSANSTTVPTNGTVGLTAFVIESGGTPVQNGTSVRFTTTLGTITPSDAQTTNGVAVATFNAGANSGVATIHAVSGGAGGGSGTTSGGTGTTTPTATNVVTITVGVAAVKTMAVTASPTSVGPNGGSVTVTATALDPSGGSLSGIPVTFSADHGGVDPGVAITDANGQATTTLTTSVETKVTASSGTATATATVTLRPGPGVTIKCTPASGSGTCAAVPASDASNTATVTFDIAKATGSSALREVTINFGDGTSQGLGTLAGGTATVAHSYSGSSGGSNATYTAVVSATDLDNERSTASTIVNVTPRSALTIDLAATQSTSVPGQGQTVTFTATVAGGIAQSFAWDFDGDGTVDATTSSNKIAHVYTSNGRITATVTVQTTDGRSATARTEFIITGI